MLKDNPNNMSITRIKDNGWVILINCRHLKMMVVPLVKNPIAVVLWNQILGRLLPKKYQMRILWNVLTVHGRMMTAMNRLEKYLVLKD
jgi:hypothetical protein